MRVQLNGQHLRLRVDETELQSLLEGHTLDNVTRWPDGNTQHLRVCLAEADAWQRQSDGWCVELTRVSVQDLGARLPSREGLNVALPVPGAAPLEIRFDVDVHDSRRRQRHAPAD